MKLHKPCNESAQLIPKENEYQTILGSLPSKKLLNI